MDVDLNADLEAMDVADLLAYQQELTRARKAVLDAQARAQAHIDYRASEIAARRAREDQLLGASGKPPAQELMAATPPNEAGS